METSYKKFYRSITNRRIAGICGGLGKYLKIDPAIIRIIFLFLLICSGCGLLLYIIFWIAIPEEPNDHFV